MNAVITNALPSTVVRDMSEMKKVRMDFVTLEVTVSSDVVVDVLLGATL